MSFLDRLLGRRPEPHNDSRQSPARRPSDFAGATPPSGQLSDEQALERYRYLLRTAPPEAIEQAHAEAFTQLTPEQRQMVLQGLSRELPPEERMDRDDPQSLARAATRAELRRPGTLERTFGGMSPGGIGLGGFMAGNFLSTIAGFVIGSAIADAIFNDSENGQGDQDSADASDSGQDADAGASDFDSGDGGYDSGGDFGGGGFGGGDFGGGDFGGGDF
jgi:hypothetical protein